MKKLLITAIMLLALTLTACGSASNAPQADSARSSESLSEAAQLSLGSFKLEGTENAITAEQALNLKTLWQVYQSLNQSDSASQEEITALIEQIKGTMTPGQMQAINAMKLTQEDVFAMMQEQGIITGDASEGNNDGGNESAEGFTPPNGGAPHALGGGGGGGGGEGGEGGFPGGGEGGGPGGNGGQALSPDQIATAQAHGPGGGGPRGVPSALIDALIQLLNEKAGS